jgi:hypothetical protein
MSISTNWSHQTHFPTPWVQFKLMCMWPCMPVSLCFLPPTIPEVQEVLCSFVGWPDRSRSAQFFVAEHFYVGTEDRSQHQCEGRRWTLDIDKWWRTRQRQFLPYTSTWLNLARTSSSSYGKGLLLAAKPPGFNLWGHLFNTLMVIRLDGYVLTASKSGSSIGFYFN